MRNAQHSTVTHDNMDHGPSEHTSVHVMARRVKGFPLLQKLVLSGNNIMGTLPAEWASPGALPRLKVLQLDSNQLSGECHTAS